MTSTLLWLPALRSVRFGPARTGQEQPCRVGVENVSLTQHDVAPSSACIDGVKKVQSGGSPRQTAASDTLFMMGGCWFSRSAWRPCVTS